MESRVDWERDRRSVVHPPAIAARRFDGFRWQHGKIAVGGRWHRQCLLSASGVRGINRRAQTFVRVSFLPKPLI